MGKLSPGQQDALLDLTTLQEASEGSIEHLSQKMGVDGSLLVDVSIECLGFTHRPPGLRLRDRERFWLVIKPQFPIEPPTVFAPDHRFAFSDHVYWAGELGVWLCVFYSTDQQWQPSHGIAGFMWRLLQWLELASVGELDAPGQPRHPPLAGGVKDQSFFVAREDCPTFDQAWAGYAVLNKRSKDRFDIVGWSDDACRHDTELLAPAILLDRPFTSEFPDHVSSLMLLLKHAGIDERILAVRLLLHARNTKGRPPIYLVLGVAMRGLKDDTAEQHLFIWKIPTRTANDLRNLCRKFKRNNKSNRKHLLSKSESIVASWNQSTERLTHCRIFDQRPAVSHRRDVTTPLANLLGKSVTLWGAGALGSYLAEALIRSGIKRLCIVDYGRVSPGLLVRQNYVDDDIGERKVDALCRRLRKVDPSIEIKPIAADLLRDYRRLTTSLANTELLIDATASRRVAMIIDQHLSNDGPQDFAIASVGNDSVAGRGLITFTPPGARYGPTDLLHRAYLVLCEEKSTDWLESFWPPKTDENWFEPEPGCSSPTFHGSGGQTMSLAGSMLTETARLLSGETSPSVVGIVPFFSGEPDFHQSFEEHPRGTCPITGNDVRFLPPATLSIEQAIEALDREMETGGVLFGFRDDYLKIVWVVAATGPPVDSCASPTSFVCGVDGIADEVEEWQSKTHGLVGFVGTWHSHPISSPTPSVTDLEAMRDLLTQSGSPMHRLLLTIVGYSSDTPELGTFVFRRDSSGNDEPAL